MKPDLFSIGPITIHGYGAMIALGILCCIFMGMYRAKKRDMNPEAVLDIAIFGVLFGFIGAKLLYVIVELPYFIKNPMDIIGSSGFVVYGGIIAGVLAAIVYCKKKNLVFMEYFDLCMPSVAIAQGFGRLGCFMAGCCYGRQTDAWYGVIFPAGSMAPAGVKVIPTQLISSLGDFLIMGILLWYSKRAKHTGDVGAMYMLLYGVGRFFIEYLRADDRGAVGILSTSQLISVFIVLGAWLLFYWNKKRSEKQSEVMTEE